MVVTLGLYLYGYAKGVDPRMAHVLALQLDW